MHTFEAVLPERVYAVGTHRSSEIAIPSEHTTFEIRVGVAESLDAQAEIVVGLNISIDGGTTWQSDGAAVWRGGAGPPDRSTGVPMTAMRMRGRLWGSDAGGRALRVRISVRGHATTLGPVDLFVSDEPVNPHALGRP